MNLNIDVFSIQSKNGGTTSHSYPAMIVSPAMIVGKRRRYEMLGVKPAKWRYTIIYIYRLYSRYVILCCTPSRKGRSPRRKEQCQCSHGEPMATLSIDLMRFGSGFPTWHEAGQSPAPGRADHLIVSAHLSHFEASEIS